MTYFATLPVAHGCWATVFHDPDAGEWRELEGAVDPVDGVRGYVLRDTLYAWLPAVLHEEIRPALAERVGGNPRFWLPVAVRPGLGDVTVTTSLSVDDPAALENIRRTLRRCPALLRRLGPRFRVTLAGRLAPAA